MTRITEHSIEDFAIKLLEHLGYEYIYAKRKTLINGSVNMFDELNKYKNNGHFFFQKGDSLSIQSKDFPGLPGVYYILRLAKGKVDLVYIGKSGTMLQNGQFKSQLLKGRINNKQEGIKRQQYFEQKMEQENIDSPDIYWFVTYE